MKRDSRVPLILAIVLLLLPVLYVGSYFAPVVPGGIPDTAMNPDIEFPPTHNRIADAESEYIFWPLERIHRKLWPTAWDDEPPAGPFPPLPFPPTYRRAIRSAAAEPLG